MAGAPWTNTFSPTKPMASLANPPAFAYGDNPTNQGLAGADGDTPEVFVPLQGASPQQSRPVKIQPPHLAVPQLARADDISSDGRGEQQRHVQPQANPNPHPIPNRDPNRDRKRNPNQAMRGCNSKGWPPEPPPQKGPFPS